MMNTMASDALALVLAMDFDPDLLEPGGRAIYEVVAGRSEHDRRWIGLNHAMMRIFAWERRRDGASDPEIFGECLGCSYDVTAEGELPANRKTAIPRALFIPLQKALIRLALTHADDDFEEWEGDLGERMAEPDGDWSCE